MQTFQTQIETLYFKDAFPLIKGNFEDFKIILRGALEAVLFASLTILVTNRIKKPVIELNRYILNPERIINQSLWLGIVYLILYLSFGYFIAWQSEKLRLFYGGPAQFNSFMDQMKNILLEKPEIPFFQYCRGVLWIACLLPIFKGFMGGRKEGINYLLCSIPWSITYGSTCFANPLMPSQVSCYHFFEVSVSNAIFGSLVAFTIPDNQLARQLIE